MSWTEHRSEIDVESTYDKIFSEIVDSIHDTTDGGNNDTKRV